MAAYIESNEINTWTMEYEEYLISLIRPRRCLWDVKSPLYRKKSYRHSVMKGICRQMKARWPAASSVFTYEKVLKKFKNMRTYFHRMIRSLDELKTESPCDVVQPQWVHFSRLSFLQGSSSNLNDTDYISAADCNESPSYKIVATCSLREPPAAAVVADVSSTDLKVADISAVQAATAGLEAREVAIYDMVHPVPQEHGHSELKQAALQHKKGKKDECEDTLAASTKDLQQLNTMETKSTEENADLHFGRFVGLTLTGIKDLKDKDMCRLEIMQALLKYRHKS